MGEWRQIAAFVFLGGWVWAGLSCATPAATDQPRGCPRLDSRLSQLSQSADPEGFAASAGLELNSSGVRAVVELADGTEIPAGHGVIVEARYLNSVQARVPLKELCPLARERSVLSVAPPARGIPLSPRP